MGSLDPLSKGGGPDASNEAIHPSPQSLGADRLTDLTARVREFGRRRRTLIAIVGSLATAAVLVLVLAGRRDVRRCGSGAHPRQDGVAAAAAAGVLMTVTGTVGGLCFAAWAGADQLGAAIRGAWLRRASDRVSRAR
jgi:hypothetical protein